MSDDSSSSSSSSSGGDEPAVHAFMNTLQQLGKLARVVFTTPDGPTIPFAFFLAGLAIAQENEVEAEFFEDVARLIVGRREGRSTADLIADNIADET